jgi:phage-related protein
MTLPVFPAQIPLEVQMRQAVEPVAESQKLGDGYEYICQFGLHPIRETWQVNVLIKPQDLPTLLIFLEERAIDGLPFQWTPPDGDPSQTAPDEPDSAITGIPWLWSVDQWSTPRNVRGRIAIKLNLRRRFDHIKSQNP